MATLNDLTRDELLKIIRMANFEIESLRIAEFEFKGHRTSAIGIVQRQPDGYRFDARIMYITDEMYKEMEAVDNGDVISVGYPEPKTPQ